MTRRGSGLEKARCPPKKENGDDELQEEEANGFSGIVTRENGKDQIKVRC